LPKNLVSGRIRCKGFSVVFWKMLERENQKSGEIERIPLLRYYKVYPESGVDGLEVPAEKAAMVAPIDAAEEVVRHMPNPPSIKYGGRDACYFPSRDVVLMPEMQSFADSEEFYSTLFHELAHSTGYQNRLDRVGVTANWAFGSHEYSEAELIAEMTSSFLCGFAGIGQKTMPNSAAYIGGWLRKLQADPRYIIKASSKAQKAVDYILVHHNEDLGGSGAVFTCLHAVVFT
jgi:antirestriction protein ArdC